MPVPDDQRLTVRRLLGMGFQGAAFVLLLAKSLHIPWVWINRPFGSFMGNEADFAGSAFLTLLATLAAIVLLSASRWVLKRWGALTFPCLAVILVHLVQDGVLAWAAYFR